MTGLEHVLRRALPPLIVLLIAISVAQSALAEAEKPATPKIGAPAPDFALKDQNGKEWRLSAHRGKTVLVSFGTISCTCGQDAAKEHQGIQEKYASRGLAVVHVNTEPWISEYDPTYLSRFAKDNKITYPMLVDKGLAASSQYQTDTMLLLCLVDTRGVLRFTLAGHPDDYVKTVTEQVEKLLPPPPKQKASEEKREK